MARLEWSRQALAGLDELVLSHSLPPNTRDLIEASAEPLRRFPRLGPQIDEYPISELPDGGELRFLIGPWPWLVIVYLYLESENRIVVVSVEDGRAASATISRKRPPG